MSETESETVKSHRDTIDYKMDVARQNITDTGICDCGHAPTTSDGLGTGYGYQVDDGEVWTMCYPCCAVETRDDVMNASAPGRDPRVGGLYMNTDGSELTTWTGEPIARVIWRGEPHPFARRWRDERNTRRYYNAVFTAGCERIVLSGVAAPGEYATARVIKGDR